MVNRRLALLFLVVTLIGSCFAQAPVEAPVEAPSTDTDGDSDTPVDIVTLVVDAPINVTIEQTTPTQYYGGWVSATVIGVILGFIAVCGFITLIVVNSTQASPKQPYTSV